MRSDMDSPEPAGEALPDLREALRVALDRLAEYMALHDGESAELFDTTEDRDFIREARAAFRADPVPDAAPADERLRKSDKRKHAGHHRLLRTTARNCYVCWNEDARLASSTSQTGAKE